MHKTVVLVLVLVTVVVASCGSGDGRDVDAAPVRPAAATTTTTAVPTTTTTAAPVVEAPAGPLEGATRREAGRAVIPLVAVFDAPGAGRPRQLLRNPVPEGYPLVFLIEERRPDGWLHVALPQRPNESTGWVWAEDLEIWEVHGRVLVEIGARRLRYWEGEELVLDETVATGTPRTPTPTGRFFVDIVARPPNPRGPYGPYQVSVTGFSDVLKFFDGGQGQIALHGTNRPDLLGREVSNGCVRMRNVAVTQLAERARIGTPVEIVP